MTIGAPMMMTFSSPQVQRTPTPKLAICRKENATTAFSDTSAMGRSFGAFFNVRLFLTRKLRRDHGLMRDPLYPIPLNSLRVAGGFYFPVFQGSLPFPLHVTNRDGTFWMLTGSVCNGYYYFHTSHVRLTFFNIFEYVRPNFRNHFSLPSFPFLVNFTPPPSTTASTVGSRAISSSTALTASTTSIPTTAQRPRRCMAPPSLSPPPFP